MKNINKILFYSFFLIVYITNLNSDQQNIVDHFVYTGKEGGLGIENFIIANKTIDILSEISDTIRDNSEALKEHLNYQISRDTKFRKEKQIPSNAKRLVYSVFISIKVIGDKIYLKLYVVKIESKRDMVHDIPRIRKEIEKKRLIFLYVMFNYENMHLLPRDEVKIKEYDVISLEDDLFVAKDIYLSLKSFKRIAFKEDVIDTYKIKFIKKFEYKFYRLQEKKIILKGNLEIFDKLMLIVERNPSKYDRKLKIRLILDRMETKNLIQSINEDIRVEDIEKIQEFLGLNDIEEPPSYEESLSLSGDVSNPMVLEDNSHLCSHAQADSRIICGINALLLNTSTALSE